MSSNPSSPEPVAPTTPENANVDLPLSTPTVHKLSTTIPYTTGHIIRDESLIALGCEMIGYIVGPMPSEQFLDFMPSKRGIPPFSRKPFKALANHKHEAAMYERFVRILLFLVLSGRH